MRLNTQRIGASITVLLLGLRLTGIAAEVQMPPAKGQVIYHQDFEGADALNPWTGTARLEDGYQSAKAVAIEQKEIGTYSSMISMNLPAETLRGCVLTASAMVKALDVSSKPNSWNGVKYMISVESPAGKTFPQADLGTGSFEWRKSAFTLRIPADATQITVHLGLENVRGKVWFDDIKIVVAKPPVSSRSVAFTGNGYTGHSVPRLRGAMVSPTLDEDSLSVLGHDWNANLTPAAKSPFYERG